MKDLELAWGWRKSRGLLDSSTEAIRVFHGPGEGSGALRSVSIDRFGSHYWVTQWEEKGSQSARDVGGTIGEFLRAKGADSAVALWRPEKSLPDHPVVLFGNPPEGRFPVMENGARFLIQLREGRHPGLFLDHAPLRAWLMAQARGWRVLNTFAYTGSLSVAAGMGDASHVTTLDLSKATTRWAKENWDANTLPEDAGRFIGGDVFEWLPKMARRKENYDCVILDPPSFSRGKKGSFSTAKDLKKLHLLAMELLAPGGVLATSINSASIPRKKFEGDVLAAASEAGIKFQTLWKIELPETFVVRDNAPESERYLKGLVLKRIN